MDENASTASMSSNIPVASMASAKNAMRTPEPRRSVGGSTVGGAAAGRSSKRMMHKDLNRLASMGGGSPSSGTPAAAAAAGGARNLYSAPASSTPVRGAMP